MTLDNPDTKIVLHCTPTVMGLEMILKCLKEHGEVHVELAPNVKREEVLTLAGVIYQ